MTSRSSSRYALIRDLPPAFVLFGCAVAAVSFFMFFVPYRYSSQESEPRPKINMLGPELNEFNFESSYAGEIITGSIYENECRKIIFDNRNGNMWDKGQVNCDDVSRRSLQKKHLGIGNAPRLHEISKAFRQGDLSASWR